MSSLIICFADSACFWTNLISSSLNCKAMMYHFISNSNSSRTWSVNLDSSCLTTSLMLRLFSFGIEWISSWYKRRSKVLFTSFIVAWIRDICFETVFRYSSNSAWTSRRYTSESNSPPVSSSSAGSVIGPETSDYVSECSYSFPQVTDIPEWWNHF